MKTISEDALRENMDKFIDANIAQQREIRDYWAAFWNAGEGNSELHAHNMTTAQDCLNFLSNLKRGTSCDGCAIRSKAAQLEMDNALLQQEITGYLKGDKAWQN